MIPNKENYELTHPGPPTKPSQISYQTKSFDEKSNKTKTETVRQCLTNHEIINTESQPSLLINGQGEWYPLKIDLS